MQILHEINLAKLWRLVRVHYLGLAGASLGAAVVMFAIGGCIPKIYESEVKLAPETSTSSFSGTLGSLSSLMGMKGNLMGNEDAISPELYPDVLSSPDFMLSLLDIRVTTKDGKVRDATFRDYLTKHCKAPWWDKVAMSLMKGLEKDGDGAPVALPVKDNDGGTPRTVCLTKQDYKLIKGVEGTIRSQVDKKTDVITISVTAQDPLVATIMVDSVSSRLQDFITDYRTRKARKEVAYLEQVVKKAHDDYARSQKNYAAFSDSHLDAVLSEYKVKEEALENDLQLKYTIYSQMMVQLQTAKAKVMERTPVYTVIQAAMMPHKHMSPKRSLMALFGLFAGFSLAYLVFYARDEKARKREEACAGAVCEAAESVSDAPEQES